MASFNTNLMNQDHTKHKQNRMFNCLYSHSRMEVSIDTTHTLSQQLTDWTTEPLNCNRLNWTDFATRSAGRVGGDRNVKDY